MSQLHKNLSPYKHGLLHHANGAHRTTPSTTLGSHVDGFEHSIDFHLDAHENRVEDCGIAFDHTPDRDIDPGPDCAICGKPRT